MKGKKDKEDLTITVSTPGEVLSDGTVFEQTIEERYQIYDQTEEKFIVLKDNQDPWTVWQNNGFPPSAFPPSKSLDECSSEKIYIYLVKRERVKDGRRVEHGDNREIIEKERRKNSGEIYNFLTPLYLKFGGLYPA